MVDGVVEMIDTLVEVLGIVVILVDPSVVTDTVEKEVVKLVEVVTPLASVLLVPISSVSDDSMLMLLRNPTGSIARHDEVMKEISFSIFLILITKSPI